MIEFEFPTFYRKWLDADVEGSPGPFVSQNEMRLLVGVEGSGVTGLRWLYPDRQNRHDYVFVLTVRRSHQFSGCFILMLCLGYDALP